MDNQLKRDLSQITQLLKAGDHAEALKALKSAYIHYPKNEILLGLLASQYAELNMYDSAKSSYEALLVINENNFLARFQLGMLEFQLGNIDDAIAHWESVATQKDDFVANYWIAQAYLKNNQKQQAKPYISKANEKVPLNHELSDQIRNLHSLVQEV